jgi:hypothetical protein
MVNKAGKDSSKAGGEAAKQLATIGSETTTRDEIADEAPKAPVDGIVARVLASITVGGDYSLFDINHDYQLEPLARIAKHIHSSYVYR